MIRMILAVAVLLLGGAGIAETLAHRERYARLSSSARRLGGAGHMASAYALGVLFLEGGGWGVAEVLAFAGFCCWFSMGVLIMSPSTASDRPAIGTRGWALGVSIAAPGGLLIVLASGRLQAPTSWWIGGLGCLLVFMGFAVAYRQHNRELPSPPEHERQ